MSDKEFVETNLRDHKDVLTKIVLRFLNDEMAEMFDDAVIREDIEMAWSILQDTWNAAPDEPWIHEIPGWLLLCDICASPDYKE